ncbi:MAG: hypothetical protein Q9187_005974 [Circinaria calcarea]
MDPLSITAAIIAIVGAGGKVGTGLRKLVELRNAPDSLLQLNNEVTELQLVVQAVDDNTSNNSAVCSAAAAQHELVHNALERVKDVALELEGLIEYTLTKITDAGTKIDHVAWLRQGKKVQNLKEKIRNAKNDLLTASSIASLATSKRIQLQLSELHIASEGTSSRCLELENLIHSTGGSILRQGQSMEAVLQTIVHRPTNSGVILNLTRAEAIIATDELSVVEEQLPSVSDEPRSGTGFLEEQYQDNSGCKGALHMEFTKYQRCCSSCLCSCHHQNRVRSPRLLNDILGSLLIGYSGLPCYRQTCDRDCKKGASKGGVILQYTFPGWILKKTLCMMMACSKMKGPELLLRCLRVRPEESPIFEAVRAGNLSEVKNLLVNGEASIIDVNYRGYSPLHYSPYCPEPLRRTLVELLLQLGADPLQVNNDMISPYQNYWSSAFSPGLNSKSDRVWVATTFCQEDPIEHFEFSKLHLAILELQQAKGFDAELLATPRIVIDQRDSRGRTPLAWAAYHGKFEAVKKLLQRGADPNIGDLEGKTPLHLAVHAGGCLAVQCLDLLLQGGANIDAFDSLGDIALDHSIHYDEPKSTKFLLDSGAENLSIDMSGQSLLHMTALYGSLPILSTMRQAALHGLNIDLLDKWGWTAMELAKWRRDFNAEWSKRFNRPKDKDPVKWFNVFEDLLDSIRAADAAEHFSDFVALSNGDLDWDQEQDSGQEAQESSRSLPGSFPVEENGE